MIELGGIDPWLSWVALVVFTAGIAALITWLVRTRNRPRWWQGDQTSPEDAQSDRELEIRTRHRHQYE